MIGFDMIIFFFFFTPVLPVLTLYLAWKLFYKKKKEILIRQRKLQKGFNKLIVGSEKPFGEIRYPAMILAVSSLAFTVITFAFGIGINRLTLEPEFFFLMDPTPDIQLINPMQQFPDFCFIMTFIGYYIAVAMLCYFWLEYCKFKWIHWID